VDLRVIVFISFDPAINIKVDRHQHAERLILIFDFNLFGLTQMVKQFHPFSDQSYRALKQPSVEGDTAVFVDLSAGHFAKVVMQVIGSGSQTLQVGRKALNGSLLCAAVFSLMVDVAQPAIKGFIEFI
jgi:hypothetical protein